MVSETGTMENFTVKTFDALSLSELHETVRVREEVFFLEQRITDYDADAVDLESTYMWASEGGEMTAFLRMIPAGVIGPDAAIGRVLVRKPWRRKGICRRMMTAAIEYMRRNWHCTEITIEAQTYVKDFYVSLGFEVISDVFYDASLPHVQMRLRLPQDKAK